MSMTRTNRQHVLNLADDGGAHVFEHDTAAASAGVGVCGT